MADREKCFGRSGGSFEKSHGSLLIREKRWLIRETLWLIKKKSWLISGAPEICPVVLGSNPASPQLVLQRTTTWNGTPM